MLVRASIWLSAAALLVQDRLPVPVPAPAPDSVSRGQIADTNGDPVPYFRFVLAVGNQYDELLTDADGRFVSDLLPYARVVRIESRELTLGSSMFIKPKWLTDRSGGCWRLDVSSGPRLDLDFELPRGTTLADFEARATDMLGLHPMHAIERTELRTDGPPGAKPWVRFGSRRVCELWVLARDESMASRTRITAAQLAGSEPVPVRFRACGVIQAYVRPVAPIPRRLLDDGDGETAVFSDPAVSNGAVLTLASLNVADQSAPLHVNVPIEEARRIPWIAAGGWRVTSSSPYFLQGQDTELQVNAGCVEPLEVVLGSLASRGDVRLRIVRDDGDFADWEPRQLDMDATLNPRGRGGRGFSAASWAMCGVGIDTWFERVERDGRFVIETVFHDVPAGECELRATSSGAMLVPSTLTVRPGDEVELKLVERTAEQGLGFHIFLPESFTGALPQLVLSPVHRDVPFVLATPAPGQTAWIAAHEPPPDGDRLEWCLRVSGFENVYGDRESFVGAAATRWAYVWLQRGWSIRVRARDEAGVPVRGATVLLDGRFAATTDGRGLALLRASAPPAEPRLAFEGWRIVRGDPDPSGAFEPTRVAEIQVTLAR